MKTNNSIPSERIENAELKEMFAHALNEAEPPRNTFEKPLEPNEITRYHIPASLIFHYRNHPQMIKAFSSSHYQKFPE